MTDARARDRAPGTMARTVAQAKVNLYLRVLAREANGFHQLETLFCRLELGDDVVVRTGVSGRSLDFSGDALPPAGLGPTERNLAWRAALAYANATGWPNEWAIEIDKRIPVGGGLGGGSADAGAVLRCLNALSSSPLDHGALVALGTSLGADVPFMTIDAPLALGWGRGERLLALPCLPSRAVTLACFPFGVSTPDAYRWIDEANADATPRAEALDIHALTTWTSVASRAHNDFETVVASRLAPIGEGIAAWRSMLQQRGHPASVVMLAGSGSTVFALADSELPSPLAETAGVRTVATRTATRVVGVDVLD